MGTASSSRFIEGEDLDRIVSVLMPVYYIPNADVTAADIAVAKQSWKLIIDETSVAFKTMKDNEPTFHHTSCISWFFCNFYSRLFDIHPLCKPLFVNGLQSQGIFLVKLISLTLNQLEDSQNFRSNMSELARRHCERGVKAIEYGIVGTVLFWTIRTCIGFAAFTEEVEYVWHKIYSKMLNVIVPVTVSLERNRQQVSGIGRTPYISRKDNKHISTRSAVEATSSARQECMIGVAIQFMQGGEPSVL